MADRPERQEALTGDLEQRVAELEEKLQASEERHRFLTERISDAIWTIGLDGRVQYVSPSIEGLVGLSAEEFKSRPIEELLDEDSYDRARHTVREELDQDGQPGVDPERNRIVELRLRRADGSVFWTESNVRFVRDDSGEPCGVLGVTRDISAWKDAQEALRRSEARLRLAQRLEAVGQLAGGVAHDFNNLLTVIRGNLDLLSSDFHPADPRLRQLEEIGKASDRAASLTRQLLAFARRQHLQPQVLHLNEVLSETGQILRRLIPEDIEMIVDLAPDLWHVEADRGQIEQVLLNLAVNARDAMPRGGELRLTTSNAELRQEDDTYQPPVIAGDYVRLVVSDVGVGIPEELQSKIFEPFFTTKEVGEGTGMGLSTVYGIIKQSKGYIWVTSEEGQGATFEILLPRSGGRPSATVEPTADPSPAGGSETLLLVEDETAVRQLASRILRRAGYRVLEASTGQAAIEICASEGGRIDLIITDIVMPEMWGDELIRRLREVFPKLNVLYISGYGDRRKRQRPGNGAERFLEKPFTSERLLEKVREILDDGHEG